MNANNSGAFKVIAFIYIATILLFISISLKTLGFDDDKYFSDALIHRDFLDFLYMRYNTWTGRMLIEGLLVMTINHPWFYMLVIPLSFVAMSASLVIIASADKKITILSFCISFSLLLLINENVMSEASWWVTGSYNYLQPLAAGLLSIAIFYAYWHGRLWIKILSVVLIIFSCFNEIFAITFAIPAIVAIVIFRKDYSKFSTFYILSALCTTIFSLSAPGNRVRFHQEISRWFPDFSSLNIIDKVALGFDRLNSHIAEQNTLFLVLMGLLVFCVVTQKKSLSTFQILALIIITFKSALFFVFNRSNNLLYHFSNDHFLDFGNVGYIEEFLPYVFTLMILFACISMMILLCDSIGDLINMPAIFIMGIASVVMMGLSPTVYASGLRIVFIFNVSIVYLSLYLILNKLSIRNQ